MGRLFVEHSDLMLRGVKLNCKFNIEYDVDEDGVCGVGIDYQSLECFSKRCKGFIPCSQELADMIWEDYEDEFTDKAEEQEKEHVEWRLEEKRMERDYWSDQFSRSDMAQMRRGY